MADSSAEGLNPDQWEFDHSFEDSEGNPIHCERDICKLGSYILERSSRGGILYGPACVTCEFTADLGDVFNEDEPRYEPGAPEDFKYGASLVLTRGTTSPLHAIEIGRPETAVMIRRYAEEDPEDRWIRQGAEVDAKLTVEQREAINRHTEELYAKMQEPGNAEAITAAFESISPREGLGFWERKGAMIIAFLDETMPITDDMPEHIAEAIDIERQTFVMRSGLNNMTPDELEAKWLEGHESLPYVK